MSGNIYLGFSFGLSASLYYLSSKLNGEELPKAKYMTTSDLSVFIYLINMKLNERREELGIPNNKIYLCPNAKSYQTPNNKELDELKRSLYGAFVLRCCDVHNTAKNTKFGAYIYDLADLKEKVVRQNKAKYKDNPVDKAQCEKYSKIYEKALEVFRLVTINVDYPIAYNSIYALKEDQFSKIEYESANNAFNAIIGYFINVYKINSKLDLNPEILKECILDAVSEFKELFNYCADIDKINSKYNDVVTEDVKKYVKTTKIEENIENILE